MCMCLYSCACFYIHVHVHVTGFLCESEFLGLGTVGRRKKHTHKRRKTWSLAQRKSGPHSTPLALPSSYLTFARSPFLSWFVFLGFSKFISFSNHFFFCVSLSHTQISFKKYLSKLSIKLKLSTKKQALTLSKKAWIIQGRKEGKTPAKLAKESRGPCPSFTLYSTRWEWWVSGRKVLRHLDGEPWHPPVSGGVWRISREKRATCPGVSSDTLYYRRKLQILLKSFEFLIFLAYLRHCWNLGVWGDMRIFFLFYDCIAGDFCHRKSSSKATVRQFVRNIFLSNVGVVY